MGLSKLDEKTEKKLNALLEKAHDAEQGYRKVAEHIKNIKLKTFLLQKAEERKSHVKQLKKTLIDHNIKIRESNGSTVGSIHRAWIDTKAFFSTDNDKAMLVEVKKGEKVALEDYEDVLDTCDIAETMRWILENQKNDIQSSYSKANYL